MDSPSREGWAEFNTNPPIWIPSDELVYLLIVWTFSCNGRSSLVEAGFIPSHLARACYLAIHFVPLPLFKEPLRRSGPRKCAFDSYWLRHLLMWLVGLVLGTSHQLLLASQKPRWQSRANHSCHLNAGLIKQKAGSKRPAKRSFSIC